MKHYPTAILLMVSTVLAIAMAISVRYSFFQIHTNFSSPSSEVASIESATFTFDAIVTAYCPGACCCGKWADGYTASGVPAIGKIVAAPPMIPFGTVLDIPAMEWPLYRTGAAQSSVINSTCYSRHIKRRKNGEYRGSRSRREWRRNETERASGMFWVRFIWMDGNRIAL